VVFAKSSPIDNPETLYSHTLTVLKEAQSLRDTYGTKILQSVPEQYRQFFWEALFLACKVHDLGKVQSLFQNKIRKAIKKDKTELLPVVKGISDVPHNIISPAFLHNLVEPFPENIRPTIYQAVAFHHGRGREYLLNDRAWIPVDDVIRKDVEGRMKELDEMQPLFGGSLVVPSSRYLRKLQAQYGPEEARFYLLLKGLLHRADHAGSANMAAEMEPHKHSAQHVIDYLMLKRKVTAQDIWQTPYAYSSAGRNVILQAGTGSGKTEFALLWIGDEKAFYALPMRTSVNAMYERLKETYNSEYVGLLHSDSAMYALSAHGMNGTSSSPDNGISDTLYKIDAARQLAMPISVCTADQVFTATFRYEGYEKIFATLAYSKLVVDEIQSYDPDMVAVILKTLKDISDLGGKYCIITATLPKMYLDYIAEKTPGIEMPPPRFKSTGRHRVKLMSNAIDDPEVIDKISDLSTKHKGVLVIANTVKMAKSIKSRLHERRVPAFLLHSMFTYEDRELKEQFGILKCQNGIWITTQLAEVSLNIDFDVMVTEISSIDSQIQRWGRVWRSSNRPEYSSAEPNIYVAKVPSDKGSIYDKDLVSMTEQALCRHDSPLLSDADEFELVQHIFGDPALEDSRYKAKFNTSIKMLEEYNFSVETKSEAQRLFRRILNVSVIPSEVYSMSQDEIDKAVAGLHSTKGRTERLRHLQTIKKKTVSIPYHYFKEINSRHLDKDYDIIVANMKYSFETGAELAPVPSAVFI
jgi:CRISPR-associated endonuclease/helicase Cas3